MSRLLWISIWLSNPTSRTYSLTTLLIVADGDMTFTSKVLFFADNLTRQLFLVDILLFYLFALRHFVRFLSDILNKRCLRCTPLFVFNNVHYVYVLSSDRLYKNYLLCSNSMKILYHIVILQIISL